MEKEQIKNELEKMFTEFAKRICEFGEKHKIEFELGLRTEFEGFDGYLGALGVKGKSFVEKSARLLEISCNFDDSKTEFEAEYFNNMLNQYSQERKKEQAPEQATEPAG